MSKFTRSEATAQDIAQYYGRTKNVHVVYHGVDHQQFNLPRTAERDASWQRLHQTCPKLQRPYLLFVGQLQPRKNIIRLVEAFEELRQTDAQQQLVIAGAHGWLQKPILERILRSPAHEHIILAGRVPEDLLPSLYWRAEAFVLPNLYEGFGMPLLEAQTCGCPVVTSNVSSMPEVVGDSAITVDPHNSKAIAAGIQQALINLEKLSAVGVLNAQKFSWDTCTQQTLDILR